MQQDSSADILDQIIGLLQSKHRSIRLTRSQHVYRIEFENQKRIVLNFNAEKGVIWLAGETSSAEFALRGGHWLSTRDGSGLLDMLSQAIDQSLPGFDLQPKTLSIIDAENPAPHVRRQTQQAATTVRGKPSWRHAGILALGLIVFLCVMCTSRTQAPQSKPVEAATGQARQSGNNPRACDANAPVNGSVKAAQAEKTNRAGKLPLEISNQHYFDMLVMLTAPDSATPLQSIYVRSKSTMTVDIPSGTFQLMFSVGRTWCSFQNGFSDGSLQKLQQRISFRTGTPSLLSLQPNGAKPEQFTVFIRNEAVIAPDQTRQTVMSDGSVDLQQASDGHYYIRGFVNESPVNFLLDTGATRTFIAYNTAMQAGIRDCQPATFNTANGKVDGCVGTIPELKIGPFVIQNAIVSTARNNNDVNLLGMDILGKLQVSSIDGSMHLASH